MPADSHGRRSGYTFWGCRCAECTAADKAYKRPPRPKTTPPEDRHGTASGYTYWGCRCTPCRSAANDAGRAQRAKRHGPTPEGPVVTKRYRYKLDVPPSSEAALRRVFGGYRFVYNSFLALARDTRAAGAPHPSQFDGYRALVTEARQNPDTIWLQGLPTAALKGAVYDAARAYRNFFDSRTGKRKGKKVGFPRFKRRRARQTARFYEGGFSIRGGWQNTGPQGGRLRLSKVGYVSVNWHRPLPSHPSSVTITREPDGTWLASFVVLAPIAPPPPPVHPERVVGIDLGLTDLVTAAYSDGTREKIPAPRFFRIAERKLARAQRKLSRTQRGSKNREKTRARVARIHSRVANLRQDFARQVAARLIRENQAIVVESLNISGLARTRLAKSVYDAGWGILLNELETRADPHARTLVKADRFFPSSQICAVCDTRSERKPLNVREWTCTCGAALDRDFNAATNLMVLALAAGRAERLNACGRDVRLRLAGAVSDEAGTRRSPVISRDGSGQTERLSQQAWKTFAKLAIPAGGLSEDAERITS